MARETVLRMLKKRLNESKVYLDNNNINNDLTDVLGGNYDPKIENQFIVNMKTDIEQLEFLIKCLKHRYK